MSSFPFLESWFSVLVSTVLFHTFWQSFVVVGLGFLLLKLAKNESADFRYRFAMSTMILCASLPLLNVFWLKGGADSGFGRSVSNSLPVVSIEEIQGDRSAGEAFQKFLVQRNWLIPVEKAGFKGTKKAASSLKVSKPVIAAQSDTKKFNGSVDSALGSGKQNPFLPTLREEKKSSESSNPKDTNFTDIKTSVGSGQAISFSDQRAPATGIRQVTSVEFQVNWIALFSSFVSLQIRRHSGGLGLGRNRRLFGWHFWCRICMAIGHRGSFLLGSCCEPLEPRLIPAPMLERSPFNSETNPVSQDNITHSRRGFRR